MRGQGTAAELAIFPDPPALARGVAQQVVRCAADAIRARGRFLLALAGGSSPKAAYTTLASDTCVDRVDWPRVHLLWGDERCVPPDDPRSNYYMAREALLDRVPIPPDQVHRMRGEDDPPAAAAEYERQLRALLGRGTGPPQPGAGLDCILLGLGEDGHTASLFPGGRAVRERVRWVMAEYVESVRMWRLTLTPVVINAARSVTFVVSGGSKADRLRDVVDGPRAPDRWPAQVVAPVAGRLAWLVDEAAAAALRHRPLRP